MTELHVANVALDHESKSIDSKQVEVYLFQYPMHELFVAAGDISGAFSMRNPTGAYNNNSCHKLRSNNSWYSFAVFFPGQAVHVRMTISFSNRVC